MRVDGGANWHNFGYKNQFYVLFVRPASVHVAGGSILSAAGVGLVPVVSPGFQPNEPLHTAQTTSP